MRGTNKASLRASALGAELKNARRARGITQAQLAEAVEVTRPTVSRYEDGTRFPDLAMVGKICEALDLDDEAAAELVERVRDGDHGPWLAVTIHEQQRQLNELLAREREAVVIRSVTPLLVPGLLQTSDYARAMMIAGEVPDNQVETRVAVRIGRREALKRPKPARLVALINESVLRQMIGGPEVMATQLRYLLGASKWPNVDLRIVPNTSGWHPGLEGPFDMDEFADGTAIVHIETRSSGLFLNEAVHVAPYRAAAKKVLGVAMSAAESAELIAREAERIEETI
jgi:transcriptional regulator with XRE-family HTH domain